MKITTIVIPMILAAMLSACAAPAARQSMVVKPEVASSVTAQQKGKFRIGTVGGGKVTNPMWTSQVSKENFEGALQESLLASGLAATDTAGSRYSIDADLVTLQQPMFGLTFEVVSTVNYRIYGEGLDKQFPVTAKGVADTSDAILGFVRLKLANEKSIQENITEFIRQLAASGIQ